MSATPPLPLCTYESGGVSPRSPDATGAPCPCCSRPCDANGHCLGFFCPRARFQRASGRVDVTAEEVAAYAAREGIRLPPGTKAVRV